MSEKNVAEWIDYVNSQRLQKAAGMPFMPAHFAPEVFTKKLKKRKNMAQKQIPTQRQYSMPNDWSRMTKEGMEFLRRWVKDQKKAQGLAFQTAAGSQVNQQINVQQQGKFFLGFGFVADPVSGTVPQGPMNLLINNEQFIVGSRCEFYDVATINDEFFYYPRPMTGLQTIELQVTDAAARLALFNIYYI